MTCKDQTFDVLLILWHLMLSWPRQVHCFKISLKNKTEKRILHVGALTALWLNYWCACKHTQCQEYYKCVWARHAISPWCKRWGRSCELHLQEHVQPLDLGNSSAQTLHDHSNSAPRRLLHLCTPAAHLYQCGAWGKKGRWKSCKHREVRYYTHFALLSLTYQT